MLKINSIFHRDGEIQKTAISLRLHIFSFIVLSLLAFHLNSPVAFFRFDGIYLLSIAFNQPIWMAPFGVFSMNPLEGNAGLWFPTAMQLIPGFAIGSLFGREWLPTVAFACFATEYFVATLILGRAIGIPKRMVLLGAWILSLGLFPYLVPAPASERVWGNPHLLTAIAATTLAMAAFISIKGISLRTDIFRTLIALFLLSYIGFSQPITTVLAWPAFFFIASFSLLYTVQKNARIIKIVGLSIIFFFLALFFWRYLFGLFAYAKTSFFWSDLNPMTVGWRQQSFLLDYGSQFRWVGVLLWLGAVGGAVTVAKSWDGVQRLFAFSFIVCISGLMLLSLGLGLLQNPWRGPVPAYFDLFLFPFYGCFLGVALYTLTSRWHALQKYPPWVMATLPWLVLVGWKSPYEIPLMQNKIPFGWPPKATAITEKLRNEIGLNDNNLFRGRVANISGTSFSADLASIPFASQHNYDGMTAFFTGNDQRMFGLWYFGIPTLIEGNQFSSPFFHLLTSRLLAEHGVKHTRPQTTITRFNERIFRLLGVRFVISDEQQSGRTPVQSVSITEGRFQYLYELSGANLAGTVATNVVVAGSPSDAIERLKDPSINLDTTAVALKGLPNGIRLAPGTPDKLLFFRDHMEVSARSNGTSLLVLPVEYSRCINSNLHDQSVSGNPVLLRVNLSQLGILFTGKLSGTFDFRFSPLIRSDCRYKDFMDAKELLR